MQSSTILISVLLMASWWSFLKNKRRLYRFYLVVFVSYDPPTSLKNYNFLLTSFVALRLNFLSPTEKEGFNLAQGDQDACQVRWKQLGKNNHRSPAQHMLLTSLFWVELSCCVLKVRPLKHFLHIYHWPLFKLFYFNTLQVVK